MSIVFKRDIIVNYGSLDALVRELKTYINALDDIRSAVKSIMRKIEAGSGMTTERMKEMDHALVFQINQIQTEIRELATIIQNYTDEMTGIIKPVVRSNFMQVDRNDIWVNKQSINAACKKVPRIPSDVIVPAFADGYSVLDDEEEQARKWRNGEKLSEIRSTLRGSAGKFNELIEKMDALYKTVKKYEDTDDLFCARASKLKTDNTTF